MNVVFDTNIFVSGFKQPEGRASQAMTEITEGRDMLFISQPIIDELLRVLTDKFSWGRTALQTVIDWLTRYSRLLAPTETLAVLADEPDNRVLECALSADTQVIVTGDGAMLALRAYPNNPAALRAMRAQAK